MRQRTIIGALALTGVALLSGCYPQGAEYINDYDLVYTDYSPSYDFRASTTYALPDSVVKITGNLAAGELPEMVDPVYANQILDNIRANMNSYGWTEVNVTDHPDVVILPSALSTTTVNVWYDYWGWYYPYYGYGWYYPGYYPPTISSYTTGSVIIMMTKPSEANPSGTVPVEWFGVVNGLLEGSTSDMLTRIDKSVDQAFKQSPYLKH